MKYLSKENIKNKRVILRCDLNVPIKNNSILDDTKIIRSLKTINYLLKNNNKVIISKAEAVSLFIQPAL